MKKLTDEVLISDISKKVASELGISEIESEIICRSQFKFSHKLIQSNDYTPIMFMYIGKIVLNKKYSTDGKHLTKKQIIEKWKSETFL